MTTFDSGMFASNIPPYAVDGVIVEGAQDTETALKAAGMDWEVELRPALTYGGDGASIIRVPERFIVVRTDTDTPLGDVGNKYKPIQNRASLSTIIDPLVGEGAARWQALVSVDEGRRICGLLSLADTGIEVIKGDIVYPFIAVVNTHDGSGSCKVFPTAVRPVRCANVCDAALGHRDRSITVNIRHSGAIGDKLRLAENVLSQTQGHFERFAQVAQQLADVTIPTEDYVDLIDRIFPKNPDPNAIPTKRENNVARLTEAVHEELLLLPQVTATAGMNAWAIFNGITRFVDHGKGDRGFAYAMLQGGGEFKRRATEMLLEVAGVK